MDHSSESPMILNNGKIHGVSQLDVLKLSFCLKSIRLLIHIHI